MLGFTAGGSLIFYTFTTYMQKYLVNTARMDAKTASRVMTVVLFCYMILQPVFGALSDKIGRRNSMLCFGVFTVIATVPILSALAHVSDPYAAFGLLILALAGVSFYTSISGLVTAELFPTHVRALGWDSPTPSPTRSSVAARNTSRSGSSRSRWNRPSSAT